MKKYNIKSFICGFLAASLIFTLGTIALAVGTTAFSTVNVSVNGTQIGSKGETYRLPNGADAPYSISYIDENGGGTTYLPVRKIGELLGAEVGYDSKTGTVLIGNHLIEYTPADGLKMQLPSGFTADTQNQAVTAYLKKGDLVVTALKEDKAVLAGYYDDLTLEKYCSIVMQNNAIEGNPLTDDSGNLCFTHERTSGSTTFFYYAVVKESEGNFWLFNFICSAADKDANIANFTKWASLIEVA